MSVSFASAIRRLWIPRPARAAVLLAFLHRCVHGLEALAYHTPTPCDTRDDCQHDRMTCYPDMYTVGNGTSATGPLLLCL